MPYRDFFIPSKGDGGAEPVGEALGKGISWRIKGILTSPSTLDKGEAGVEAVTSLEPD